MAVQVVQTTNIATSTSTPKSNRQPVLDAWLDECRKLGEAAGAGAMSKIGWFEGIVSRSYRGDLVDGDGEVGYKAYIDAKKKKASMLVRRYQAKSKDPKKTEAAVRISEANTMIRLGGLEQIKTVDNGGLGVFNKTLKFIKDHVDIRGEVDDMLLKVAREQIKPAHCHVPLTMEDIERLLAPNLETKVKTEGELLEIVAKQLKAIAEKETEDRAAYGWDPHKRAAAAAIEQRMAQLNHVTAEARKAEEKAKRAAAKAAKKKTK